MFWYHLHAQIMTSYKYLPARGTLTGRSDKPVGSHGKYILKVLIKYIRVWCLAGDQMFESLILFHSSLFVREATLSCNLSRAIRS